MIFLNNSAMKLVESIDILDEENLSDHRWIRVNLRIQASLNSFRYKTCNILPGTKAEEKFRAKAEKLLPPLAARLSKAETTHELDDIAETLQLEISKIVRRSVGNKLVSKANGWWCEELQKHRLLVNWLRRALNRNKKTSEREAIQAQLARARAAYKKRIIEEKRKFFMDAVSDIAKENIWRAVKVFQAKSRPFMRTIYSLR